jgi:hypothetical protein
MNKQLSRGMCFGVVAASMLVFTLIAGMFSPLAPGIFLGSYIAYLLFQLIFFYIFRAIYKNKERNWTTLLPFIGFAAIPTFLSVSTRYASAPGGVVAPFIAFVMFIAGWWIFFAVRKPSVTTAGNEQ